MQYLSVVPSVVVPRSGVPYTLVVLTPQIRLYWFIRRRSFMSASKNVVAVVRYEEGQESLRKAVELSNGFEKLKKSDHVLIKPNILWGSRSKHFHQYGVVTTATLVEELIRLLREHGCENISIGEGTIVNKELGSNTSRGYKWSGIGRVARRNGVRLIDFNRGSFTEVELEKSRIQIATPVLETDFLIDVPVLKAHAQTKVSLGMKNLKGCLSMRSKKDFHRKSLDHLITLLNTKIRPDLTIIDGIYAMERGPDFIGTAHRTNLIIAGQDTLSCDLIGSRVIGIEASEVDHLVEFAQMENRSLDLSAIQIQGEKIDEVAVQLEWDRRDMEDLFNEAGVKGITFKNPGKGHCSGCIVPMEATLALFAVDNPGIPCDGVEICSGPETHADEGSQKILLVGDCAIRANRDLEGAVEVKGCPPKAANSYIALTKLAWDKKRARKIIATRLLKKLGDVLGIYDENLMPFKHYDPSEFSKAHF
jgi:uncharacterized protein (DUF362 family)